MRIPAFGIVGAPPKTGAGFFPFGGCPQDEYPPAARADGRSICSTLRHWLGMRCFRTGNRRLFAGLGLGGRLLGLDGLDVSEFLHFTDLGERFELSIQLINLVGRQQMAGFAYVAFHGGQQRVAVDNMVLPVGQGDFFQSAAVAEHNLRKEGVRRLTKVLAQPFQVYLILQNGIEKTRLFRAPAPGGQGLGPVCLVFVAKNPAAVIL